MQKYPLVFDIKRGALDDGPGIRTTVFFKGCPLSCVWCQNPESIKPDKEIIFREEKCIGCSTCASVCTQNAVSFDSADRIDMKKCNNCGLCAEECFSLALVLAGKYYSEEELSELIKKDRLFYNTSNGGVTFSGGEPMMFMDYISRVMRILKKDNIHIAIETSGYFDISVFDKKIAPYADLIFYDLKFIDPIDHKRYTGKDNNLILDNFKKLVKKYKFEIIPVIPLIPDITDTDKNLNDIKIFLKDLGCVNYKYSEFNYFSQFKNNINHRVTNQLTKHK